MITEKDDWGLDPSIRAMRQVFARMEAAYTELLEKLKISRFDNRIPRARDTARGLFERAWSLAATKRMDVGEEDVSGLYMHCLARALSLSGVDVPGDVLPDDEHLTLLVREVLA